MYQQNYFLFTLGVVKDISDQEEHEANRQFTQIAPDEVFVVISVQHVAGALLDESLLDACSHARAKNHNLYKTHHQHVALVLTSAFALLLVIEILVLFYRLLIVLLVSLLDDRC